MKFGIHSLLFSETFLERDLPLLDKAKAMGFDAVDIVPFDYDNFPAKLVRQRASDLGLAVITEIGMPENANTISPDAGIRAALERRCTGSGNTAGEWQNGPARRRNGAAGAGLRTDPLTPIRRVGVSNRGNFTGCHSCFSVIFTV